MNAIISVFDPETHVYCYRRGCVVTRAESQESTWRYDIVREVAGWGEQILRAELIAPDAPTAMDKAAADAAINGGCVRNLRES